MNARAAALVAAAFVLCGCVAVPPPGPTEADRVAFNERILDKSWANSGLPGERPAIDTQAETDSLAWVQAISLCMADSAVANYGWGFNGIDGYTLYGPSGDTVDDPDKQLAFYGCIAAHSYVDAYADVRTPAQLDFIYDYYADWLVPCVLDQGYTFGIVPTRDQFHEYNGQWTPYSAVVPNLTSTEYERLALACGAEIPAL